MLLVLQFYSPLHSILFCFFLPLVELSFPFLVELLVDAKFLLISWPIFWIHCSNICHLSGWAWYTCLWWGSYYQEYQSWCNSSLETSQVPEKDCINWISSSKQFDGVLLCKAIMKLLYLVHTFIWKCSLIILMSWQMVDFVREGFLGSSHEFRNRQGIFSFHCTFSLSSLCVLILLPPDAAFRIR